MVQWKTNSSHSTLAVPSGTGFPSFRTLNTGSKVFIGADNVGLENGTNNTVNNAQSFTGDLSHLAIFANNNRTFPGWTHSRIEQMTILNGIGSNFNDDPYVYDLRRFPKSVDLQGYWKLEAASGQTQPAAFGGRDAAIVSTGTNDANGKTFQNPGVTTTQLLPHKDYKDQSFSIKAWVLYKDGESGTIISKTNSSQSDPLTNGQEWKLNTSSGGMLSLTLVDDRPLNPTGDVSRIQRHFNGPTLNGGGTGVWNHVVVVYRAGSSEADFYINKTKIDPTTATIINRILTDLKYFFVSGLILSLEKAPAPIEITIKKSKTKASIVIKIPIFPNIFP